MVIPALQVANKIPDVYLQLWASSLLKGTRYLFHTRSFDWRSLERIFLSLNVIVCKLYMMVVNIIVLLYFCNLITSITIVNARYNQEAIILVSI